MSRKPVSDEDFSQLPGGSRRLSDKSAGPEEGYYVSRDPDVSVARGGSDETIPGANNDPTVVASHYAKVMSEGAMTAQPQHDPDDVYQGTWEAGANRFLDVSDRYGMHTAGLMHALQHGMANVQWAMWGAHNPVHGKEFGPGDRREVPLMSPVVEGDAMHRKGYKVGEKSHHPIMVAHVANALHAQVMRNTLAPTGPPGAWKPPPGK